MPGMIPGLLEMNPAYKNMRGYQFGYDTQQTPFEVAKERGLAGVVGGFADKVTGNKFDFDKRGESKKQKDTKDFLRKFVYGTDGMRQENSNTTPGFTERMGLFGTPEGRQAKYDESKKNLLGMPLPEFGVSEKLGLPNFGS